MRELSNCEMQFVAGGGTTLPTIVGSHIPGVVCGPVEIYDYTGQFTKEYLSVGQSTQTDSTSAENGIDWLAYYFNDLGGGNVAQGPTTAITCQNYSLGSTSSLLNFAKSAGDLFQSLQSSQTPICQGLTGSMSNHEFGLDVNAPFYLGNLALGNFSFSGIYIGPEVHPGEIGTIALSSPYNMHTHLSDQPANLSSADTQSLQNQLEETPYAFTVIFAPHGSRAMFMTQVGIDHYGLSNLQKTAVVADGVTMSGQAPVGTIYRISF